MTQKQKLGKLVSTNVCSLQVRALLFPQNPQGAVAKEVIIKLSTLTFQRK